MAFKPNNESSSNNKSSIPEDKQAEGYLNLYLPTANGARRKLGSIILRKGNANEMTLANWLAEDPSRIEIVRQRLELEYNSATQAPGTEFDLSLPPAGDKPAPKGK